MQQQQQAVPSLTSASDHPQPVSSARRTSSLFLRASSADNDVLNHHHNHHNNNNSRRVKRITIVEAKLNRLDETSTTGTQYNGAGDEISMLTPDEEYEDDVGSLTDASFLTLSNHKKTGSNHEERRSSTRIIKPRSDSVRVGLDRATSTLTMSTLRFSESSLYGREREMNLLKTVFSRAKITSGSNAGSSHFLQEHGQKRRQLVLVSGPAGVGKSALLYNLKPTIVREAGFVLSGKFDLQQSDEPYAAFTMACRELCDNLLAHKENPDRAGNKWQFTFEEMQATLQRELGQGINSGTDATELQVLTTVFPDLIQILGGDYLTESGCCNGSFGGSSEFFENGSQSGSLASSERRPTAHIGYMEAKNRFNYAFRRLMRVLCTFGRVCLFLDDLQWADGASLDLLESLITDCRRAAVPQPCTGSFSEASSNGTGNHHRTEQGLIVMASYRSEEVDDTHPLLSTVRELESMVGDSAEEPLSLDIQRLDVGNLELSQVNELLVDILSAETPEKTLSLAECVHRKTQGNIFYVVQFLKSLAADHGDDAPPLLRFNMGTLRWDWSVEEIQVRESATKNVVEIIQQKMKTLPEGVRNLLPIIACLGACFELSVFERVLKHFNDEVFFPPDTATLSSRTSSKEESQESAPKALVEKEYSQPLNDQSFEKVDLAEKEGPFPPDEFITFCRQKGLLVLDKKHKTIQWDHERIQEAAKSMADPEDLGIWRYKLGEFLMEEFDQKELEANIFILVNLLDEDTTKIPKNDPKRTMLAELNRTAGERAMKGAAFLSAAAYLARGIELLPVGSWSTHYKLSLNLYSSAAEAHHCIGKVEETQAYCEAVISAEEVTGRSILDKQRAWNVLLDSIAAGGETMLAQEKCLEVLALLDCKFPKRGWVFHTLGGVVKTEMNVKKMEQEIPRLPVMKNSIKQWVMKLLDKMVTFAFQNKSDIFPLVIFKGLKYTLKHGISDYSPPMLSTVGLLLAAALGDLEGCRKFGEMSLALFDKVGDGRNKIKKTAKSRTQFVTASFVLHWQLPFSALRKVLLDGYKVGLGSGDVESALWCIFVYLELGYHQGLPLGMLEKDCRVYCQQMKDLQQDQIAWAARGLSQLVLNMAGREDDCLELNGKAFDLKELLSCSDDSHSNAKGHAKRFRLDNAFWSGNYAETVRLSIEFDAQKGFFDKQFTGAYGLPPLHFHCGLACHAEYERTGKSKFKTMAQFHSSKIQDWAKKGDPNVMHYAKILKAEQAATKKRMFPESVKLYKEAILLSGRQGCRHVQALANERLGELYIRHDLSSDGGYHLQEAIRLYRDWGNHERGNRIRNREYGKLGYFLRTQAPSSLDFLPTSSHPFGANVPFKEAICESMGEDADDDDMLHIDDGFGLESNNEFALG